MPRIFMVRCPQCNRENWAMAVASGQCAWCGYVATDKNVNGTTVWYSKQESEVSEDEESS